MEDVADQRGWFGRRKNKHRKGLGCGNGYAHMHKRMCCIPEDSLVRTALNKESIIKYVDANNDEMKNFLFTLGCYEGEKVTLISVISNQFVIVIKDARYSIDIELASCIFVK